jgi:predicted chitinase
MARPTNDSEVFLNQLITQMQLHLQTVGGIYITIGTIMPSPLPLPGFKTWTGYTIPSGQGGPPPDLTLSEEVLQNFDELVVFKPEELAVSNIASNKGYAISDSTAIGGQLGGEVIKGNLKIEDVNRDLPEAKRKRESSNTSTPTNVNPTQVITACGKVTIKDPEPLLIETMKLYGIKTPLQRAHFLAQVAHETANFYYKEEIASGEAYEGRKNLGNTQKGDGRRFKGRGYIQVTGRYNYTQYDKVRPGVVTNPTVVATDYYTETAGWFWKKNDINTLAKDDTEASVLAVSIRINGKNANGLPNGWEDRKQKFCAYWSKLKENPNLYT